MLTLLYDHDDIVERYVADRIPGCGRGFGPCRAVGILKDGQFVGGYVYHNWSPENQVIEISGACENPRCLNLTILRELFTAPFRNMGAQLVMMRVHKKNKATRALLKRLGCHEYIIPRLRGRGRNDSEAILTLTDDDWFSSRFMKGMDDG